MRKHTERTQHHTDTNIIYLSKTKLKKQNYNTKSKNRSNKIRQNWNTNTFIHNIEKLIYIKSFLIRNIHLCIINILFVTPIESV